MGQDTRQSAPGGRPSPTKDGPAIDVRDLSKQFGRLTAVDHLSLRIEQGEIFGLLGPNGSGKTTTINMISGLSEPTSGTVTVMGYNVHLAATAIRKLLGSVPQETALYEEISAQNNLSFHADVFGIPRSQKRARIDAVLDLVSLTARRNDRVRTFSGGMKRRLALARALLHDPQLIYLDEPTLGVDIQARRAIWDYILALKAQGKTTLITTNYLEEAQALCDRLAIIDHGRLVAVDTPEHLKQQYGGSVIEVETAAPSAVVERLRALPGVKEVEQDGVRLKITPRESGVLVPQIISLLSQEGEIRDIAVREPNLDEVFLRLTGKALRD